MYIGRTIIILVVIFIEGCVNLDNEKRKPAINPQQWEASIQHFEKKDALHPPAHDGIVFVGSSSFTLWNDSIIDEMLPLKVIPRGFGGSTMEDVLHYIDRIVIAYKPKAVVVYEGDNDIAHYHLTPQEVKDSFLKFVSRIHSELPKTRIYILSIKPSPSRWDAWPIQKETNRLLKDMCDSRKLLTYIDVATPMFDKNGELNNSIYSEDNLHMNKKGYEIWRDILREVILKNE